MSKNPTRNYAIEYLGGKTKDTDVAAIASAVVVAAANPVGDPLGDVGDTDLPPVETLPTEALDPSLTLRPDGSGGVVFGRDRQIILGNPWVPESGDDGEVGGPGPAGVAGPAGAAGAAGTTIGHGNSFPGAPATNDLFYRDDLSLLFFYAGTRWLCTCVHTTVETLVRTNTMPLAATAADAFLADLPVDRGLDILVEAVNCGFSVLAGGTALSGSHKWVASLQERPGGGVIATLTIDSGSSGYRNVNVGTDFVIDLTGAQVAVEMSWTKTGTPGALVQTVALYYRFIGT